ncbi:hypothetical protein COO60DRAFT_117893 [Scenedesmus sp. NREL 46B-D3]|nr:hypothetical protein COO60DRAFT_117893 [Scenedesmus sp. NREL 46B-D3]
MYLCGGLHCCTLYLRVNWCPYVAAACYRASCFNLLHCGHACTSSKDCQQSCLNCCATLLLLIMIDVRLRCLDNHGRDSRRCRHASARDSVLHAAKAEVASSWWQPRQQLPVVSLLFGLGWFGGLACTGRCDGGRVCAKYKACTGRVPSNAWQLCNAAPPGFDQMMLAQWPQCCCNGSVSRVCWGCRFVMCWAQGRAACATCRNVAGTCRSSPAQPISSRCTTV